MTASRQVCIVDGCSRVRNTDGLCTVHLYRRRKFGDVHGGKPIRTVIKKPTSFVCSVADCQKPLLCKGLCKSHYERHLRGDVGADRPIFSPNTKDKFLRKTGYVTLYVPPGTPGARKPPSVTAGRWHIEEHRYVMQGILGRVLLPDENVHHKNGIRNDNRPENLELWVRCQPSGARASDLVDWAREILRRYGDAEDAPEQTNVVKFGRLA